MWNDILLIEKITMAQRVNILLYYLHFLPLIGKKIPQHWFASIKLKQVLAVLMFLLSIVGNFFMKIIYIWIMIVTPAYFLSIEVGGFIYCFVFIYVIISGFAGPLVYDTITKPNKKDYVMIQLMRMDAKRYIRVNWVISTLIQQFLLFLVVMFVLYNYGGSLWYGCIMIVISCLMRFCGNVYHFAMAQKRGKPFGALYTMIVAIVFYGIAYGGAYLYKNDTYIIHILIATGVFMIAACMFALHYERQLHYDTTIRVLMNINRSFIDGTFQKEAQIKDVEIRDSDISQQELSKKMYQDKKGYAYLNALFFQRHKRLFYKPMKRRIIGITVVFLIIDIILLLFSNMINEVPSPLVFLPFTIFLMYAISIGERVTRAMFYNCDVSLLHYGYYRQPDAISINFKLRFKNIVLLNGILATLICVGFISMFLCMKTPFYALDILLLVMTIYALAIFFSVHHLSLYYLLQPYTGELEMKSPIFMTVNMIVYFVSYLAMQIDGSMVLTLIVLGVTILYSMIALILVKKKAYKTFRIR